MSCDHTSLYVVYNAEQQPVRLVCSCNTEFRVVPVDALVTLPVHAAGPHGALTQTQIPRCRACGKPVGECTCSDKRMGVKR